MSYHAKMMNVQIDTRVPHIDERYGEAMHGSYKMGHKDARHQCAEIALEADRRIEQLEAALREIGDEVTWIEIAAKMGLKFAAEGYDRARIEIDIAIRDIARKALE